MSKRAIFSVAALCARARCFLDSHRAGSCHRGNHRYRPKAEREPAGNSAVGHRVIGRIHSTTQYSDHLRHRGQYAQLPRAQAHWAGGWITRSSGARQAPRCSVSATRRISSTASTSPAALPHPRSPWWSAWEVIRGPQSALFGRATFSGAVNMITRRASDEHEGSFSSRAGSHEDYQAAAWFSGPIIEDRLYYMVSGNWENYGGEWNNGLLEGEAQNPRLFPSPFAPRIFSSAPTRGDDSRAGRGIVLGRHAEADLQAERKPRVHFQVLLSGKRRRSFRRPAAAFHRTELLPAR